MRLIDADALRGHKYVSVECFLRANQEAGYDIYKRGWNDAIDAIIDNAPTVYPICGDKACKYRANERPKGEWKETRYETAIGITYRQTQCSNCGWGHEPPMWWNFCPNCGADMRKEEKE